jgi:hypothetical protein
MLPKTLCEKCNRKHDGDCRNPKNEKVYAWRKRNPDVYRQRQRDLMRKRRKGV